MNNIIEIMFLESRVPCSGKSVVGYGDEVDVSGIFWVSGQDALRWHLLQDLSRLLE